jgi:hypothetical protein
MEVPSLEFFINNEALQFASYSGAFRKPEWETLAYSIREGKEL